ncbi:prepilin-type N-terminal cleavage/methylation domain-containing protein (plasmid) [Acuticoccus sp. MNP-M23]|uniref:type II secretion system protein n=1 Tax=Acuticoccus sp. MNP-M23 TaxID=3072793 RepID=UPI0028157A95|nr:prepilin-type N-terminal cleavage/methylation domain-containing protein [Acuticoccus sp. MNP-M23]WMS45329.1 prepilin-type N-terminal cleavage/methylation domain-containing protein [Acuticoccus sp. MNP-M23]
MQKQGFLMQKQGFSLVELSIVLVILGLLTGGILTGQSLIRAAELRSVTTEFSKYQTATMTFRDKYFALPGDMRNATDFWGAATCPTAAGAANQTCNGNNDGKIERSGNASEFGEAFAFWQHLTNAGLIEGNYSGIAGDGGIIDADPGANVPPSRLSNGAWYIEHKDGGNSVIFNQNYGNFFSYGGVTVTGATSVNILTPEETWNIDTKMDDGRPGYGKVVAIGWNDTCSSAIDGSSSADDFEAEYRLNDNSLKCTIAFKTGF